MPARDTLQSPPPEDTGLFPGDPERRKHIRTMKKDLERVLAHGKDGTIGEEPPAGLPPSEEKETKESRAGLRRRMMLFLIGFAILVLTGGVFVWYFQKKSGEQPEPPRVGEEELPPEEQPPQDETPVLPAPFFPVEATELIPLKEGRNFSAEFGILLQKNYPPGSLRRVIGIDDQNTILTLGETLEALGIQIPPVILRELDDDYILAFYADQNGFNAPIFSASVKPKHSYTDLKEDFLLWEEQSLEEDLNALPGATGRKGVRASVEFLDNAYKGAAIRYINFSDPTISIDYAIIPEKNVLVISTSRESMYAVIDAFQEIPQD